ncbi:unnamed protein product [Phytomonas sp. Hart1]|nr:unnamed protein product [Phytomonas sp. Hart1]|eukprot:CCW66591.1 unnamed protein product [Phytomonas sp. isolate Hart1]
MKRHLLLSSLRNTFWPSRKVNVNHLNGEFVLLFPRRHIRVNAIRRDAVPPLRYPNSVKNDKEVVEKGSSSSLLPFFEVNNTSNVEKSYLELIDEQRIAFCDAFDALLENRQASYRDQVVIDILKKYRTEMRRLLLYLDKETYSRELNDLLSSKSLTDEKECALNGRVISLLRDAWLRRNHGGIDMHDEQKAIYRFYSLLICSEFVKSNTDVKVILDEMSTKDGLLPNHEIYESIIRSLIMLNVNVLEGVEENKPKQYVLGQPCILDRAASGDLAGRYMGHALAQLSNKNSTPSPGKLLNEKGGEKYLPLWGCFLELCALTDIDPTLMDLWWKKLCDFCDQMVIMLPEHMKSLSVHSDAAHPAKSSLLESPPEGILKAPLPYRCVYAVLAWCVRSHDIERCLRYFHEANARGLICDYPISKHLKEGDDRGFTSSFSSLLRHPGSLTTKSTNPLIQKLQLNLLVKLMSTAKSIRMDGGLKAIVVDDVKRLIDSSVLFRSSWGVLNDLVSGLSVRSAMQLVKICSSLHAAGDSAVPFNVWTSLLRRCAREYLLDEAASLFLFIRKQFALRKPEKRELVEIMMRMYATLPTPDFSSVIEIFFEHVLNTPKGEPAVAADCALYNLLIKAADSRNAAMMIFLEGCATGVGMDVETFENLLSSHSFSSVSSLSRKLPYDYVSTKLDTQLRIPANVDAHLRREEAQRARGKAVHDSTGDSN